jgi:hypothetical protein
MVLPPLAGEQYIKVNLVNSPSLSPADFAKLNYTQVRVATVLCHMTLGSTTQHTFDTGRVFCSAFWFHLRRGACVEELRATAARVT